MNASEPADAQASAAGGESADKLDWVLWNKRNRQKAVAFACSDPERALVVMRLAMQPFVRLLQSLCFTSGAGWEKKQLGANAAGRPRTFRILELYYGESVQNFKKDMNAVAHSQAARPFKEFKLLRGMWVCGSCCIFRAGRDSDSRCEDF